MATKPDAVILRIAKEWQKDNTMHHGSVPARAFEAMVVGWVMMTQKDATVQIATKVHEYIVPELERLRRGAIKFEVMVWNGEEGEHEKQYIDLTSFTEKGLAAFRAALVEALEFNDVEHPDVIREELVDRVIARLMAKEVK